MRIASNQWGFGQTLVAAREALGLTQRHLAEDILRVSVSTLRRWEKNETQPSGERLRHLCHALHLRGPVLREATSEERREDAAWSRLAEVLGPVEAERVITTAWRPIAARDVVEADRVVELLRERGRVDEV